VRARVSVARAAEAEAAVRHEQAVLLARAEVESSLNSYRQAMQRLEHLDDAARASDRASEIARLRFEEGGADFLEVLDAERRLLEAQDRLAAGRADAARQLVGVYRAFGGEVSARP
jgi:outer membrane protein, multidrug efflux system